MLISRDLTFKQLRAYAAVVRTGSITKAAEELYVTPPAISSQLRALKLLVGQDILRRNEDGMKPTQIGQELISLYNQVDANIHITAQRIQALQAGHRGLVSVAFVSTGKYFAPTIIKAFMQTFPDIKLNPLIGNRQLVIDALKSHSVDFAIMGRPPAEMDVEKYELGDHPNILIAPPGHPLAHNRRFNPKLLMSETILLREPGSGTRLLARRFMDQIGDGMDYPVMVMNSNESIKQAVIAGLGIAMISAHTVLSELESGRLVTLNLPGLPIMRNWILVHHADTVINGAVKCFQDFILENRATLIPVYKA